MFGHGDVVGAGIDFATGAVFWTVNGRCLGQLLDNAAGRLYPIVSMAEVNCVSANFGVDTEARPFKWAPANGDDFAEFIKEDEEEEEEEDEEDSDDEGEGGGEDGQNEDGESSAAGAAEEQQPNGVEKPDGEATSESKA